MMQSEYRNTMEMRKMYTDEEYKKRVVELGDIAMDLIMNKCPNDTREAASKMNPEDAYILGVHVGTILHIAELVPVDELPDKE